MLGYADCSRTWSAYRTARRPRPGGQPRHRPDRIGDRHGPVRWGRDLGELEPAVLDRAPEAGRRAVPRRRARGHPIVLTSSADNPRPMSRNPTVLIISGPAPVVGNPPAPPGASARGPVVRPACLLVAMPSRFVGGHGQHGHRVPPIRLSTQFATGAGGDGDRAPGLQVGRRREVGHEGPGSEMAGRAPGNPQAAVHRGDPDAGHRRRCARPGRRHRHRLTHALAARPVHVGSGLPRPEASPRTARAIRRSPGVVPPDPPLRARRSRHHARFRKFIPIRHACRGHLGDSPFRRCPCAKPWPRFPAVTGATQEAESRRKAAPTTVRA